jgi:hypothetical protein
MPHVLVVDDNGTVAWSERVTPADFETEHFCRALSQRLAWAVGDAHRHPPLSGTPVGRTDGIDPPNTLANRLTACAR